MAEEEYKPYDKMDSWLYMHYTFGEIKMTLAILESRIKVLEAMMEGVLRNL